MSAGMRLIAAQELEQLVTDIFARAGCSSAESQRIGHYLIGANLAGHDSHGVVRVPRYLQMLGDGRMLADQQVERLVDTPALAVIDGKFGFGQTVAPQAVEVGIEKCRQIGLSAVALRNSGHIGRVGDWAEMAAKAGFVSVHFVNAAGSVLVAPFGSFERRFSTAPFCIGVPLNGRSPLVLDFATSIVAEGKVMVASQGGKAIPEDALIGPDGRESNDPSLLYGDTAPGELRDPRKGAGAIRAFGEHKGSGLALMCEVLGGALSGNGCTAPNKRFANGMFSFYVDPARIDPEELFSPEVARYVDFVKAAKPSQAGTETLTPGEAEQRSAAKRRAEGVPLPADTWSALMDAARSVKLDANRLKQAEQAARS